MALVKGTNCGFVTTAPTTDPRGTSELIEWESTAVLDTTPAAVGKVTEIGFWSSMSTYDPKNNDLEVGIYADSGSGYPSTLIGSSTGHTISGSDYNKWVRVTGLNISITAETNYWIAVYVENVSSADVRSDYADLGGTGRSQIYPDTALPSPWGSTNTGDNYFSFYAVVEEASTGTNTQINIGDDWKEIAAAQLNIGDTWKEVAGIQLNIGDTWKEVF